MFSLLKLFSRKNALRNTKKELQRGQEKELNDILMTHDRERITEKVTEMGKNARTMLERSLSAITHGDEEAARFVIKEDEAIDRAEMEINWDCFSTMAMRQPVQEDLRFIFATVKLTTDLERIGDESTNIARHLLRYRPYLNLTELDVVPVMLNLLLKQMDNMISSIEHNNLPLAKQVFAQDGEIDALYENLYDDFLNTAPNCSSREFTKKAYNLALARHLERVGDHIANVAEYLCFMLTGERIASDCDPTKD